MSDDKDVWARADEMARETAPVMHTAFRHAGSSKEAHDAWVAIDKMEGDEWISIVSYGLYWIAHQQVRGS